MNYKNMKPREVYRSYMRKYHLVRIGRYALLAVYLIFLVSIWGGSQRENQSWIPIYMISLVVFFLLLRALRVVQALNFAGLEKILTHDCDAEKFAEVIDLLREKPKWNKNFRMVMAHVRGLYFAGYYPSANRLLEEVALERPSTGVELTFLNLQFNCRMALGNVEGADNVRKETLRLVQKTKKPRLRNSGEYLLKLMEGALAFQEGRYEEFRQIEEQVLSQSTCPMQELTASYRLAQADIGQGKTEDARKRLERVAAEGGTLYVANEARRILENPPFAGQEKEESPAGNGADKEAEEASRQEETGEE